MSAQSSATRESFHLMGTVFSFCLVERADVAHRAIAAAVAELRSVDELFSPYRADSLVSRVREGHLAPAAYPRLLAEVVRRCEAVTAATGGWFDPWALPGGFDPSGLVKGWAIERAAERVGETGVRDFVLSGGGDVVVRGSGPTGPWRVGIRDPRDPHKAVMVLSVTDAAVATSGSYERGPHVIDPGSGQPATGLASATVVGPDLATADAYATALYAAGSAGLGWFGAAEGYHALTLDHRLVATYTEGMPCAAETDGGNVTAGAG